MDFLNFNFQSLISPQVIDKSIDWNDINGRVIIFGLKLTFEKEFIEKHPNIYENELKINYSEVIQEFLHLDDIIKTN